MCVHGFMWVRMNACSVCEWVLVRVCMCLRMGRCRYVVCTRTDIRVSARVCVSVYACSVCAEVYVSLLWWM